MRALFNKTIHIANRVLEILTPNEEEARRIAEKYLQRHGYWF